MATPRDLTLTATDAAAMAAIIDTVARLAEQSTRRDEVARARAAEFGMPTTPTGGR